MRSLRLTSLGAACAALCCATLVIADSLSFDFEKLKGRTNLDQTPVGSSGRWSIEKLLALKQSEALELWNALPAVPMDELNGKYMGLIPNADDLEEQQKIAKAYFSNKAPGFWWLGKAFKLPVDKGDKIADARGEGYTIVRRPNGTIEYIGRFETRIGRSLIDGKTSYVMDFGPFNEGRSWVDEMRKLDDSVYIGASTSDAGNGRRKPNNPYAFILVGPMDKWIPPQ